MSTIEPPEVQRWWARCLDTHHVIPTFQGYEKHFIVDGPEADNNFCCLYIILEENRECLVVVGASLLQRGYFTGTSHQVAFQMFFAELQYPLHKVPCQYIVGFWLDKEERKVRSCVNYMVQGTRQVTQETEDSLDNFVFPCIEQYFATVTTFCCGVRKNGLNCRRLVKFGRYCPWHRYQAK